jgi:hypothetical protein
LTLLGIQRELLDVLAAHVQTQFALDEGADEQSEIDLRGNAQPHLGPGKALAQLLELFTGGGEVAAPAGLLA